MLGHVPRARPFAPKRAARFASFEALFEAVVAKCHAELPADETLDEFERAYFESDTQMRAELAPIALAAQAAKALGQPKPKFSTPLASLVNRHPDEPSKTVAMRAFVVGYRPDMLSRQLSAITVAQVIETVRKAIDHIRKQKP